MKLIIAGSRGIQDTREVFEHLDRLVHLPIDEVVCGMAKGVDLIGKDWAERNKIPVKEFPADWDTYGKKAGFIRNCAMADYANELIAFWDGNSRGTWHMIDKMLFLKKPFQVILIK